ncbi:MAG TPA: hypothetical protein VK066_15395 [Chloroflexota bacterium]|nr:hypothetical protein [Chloroflexota bacterium]
MSAAATWRARGALGLVALLLVGAGYPVGVTRAAPAGQVDPNVVVQITSPQPGQQLQGQVEIAGYAADQRSPSGSGLNERDIRLYLNDASDEQNLVDYAAAGLDSPSAAAALGPRFAQVGFGDTWQTCAFPPGHYQLIVWVSSLVAPGSRNVASVDVDVAPCPPGQSLYSLQADTIRISPPDARGIRVPQLFADVAAGADMRCAPADEFCAYDIRFREVPGPTGSLTNARTDGFYFFNVSPTRGTISLYYRPPAADPSVGSSRDVRLVPPTPSPVVRRGTATNRLAVVVQGDWIRCFVNGEQVVDVHDTQGKWGQMAWGAESVAHAPSVEVDVANAVITTPGPLAALGPVLAGS